MHVLGNPKAWLGTAYHSVLERIWALGEFDGDVRIDELWTNAIDILLAQAIAHPLNKRFADPDRWPGYYLVHAFAQLRAQEALGGQHAERTPGGGSGQVVREKELFAMGGKLVGKPDVIIGNEIRDYKSGRIYEECADGTQSVKETYIRQLRLYGRLVEEHLGLSPTKGILLPMQGAPVEVSLNRQDCAVESEKAVRLLDSYNAQLHCISTASNLATPSPQACRWCQYKAICPAFWDSMTQGWTEGLGSACVRGTLERHPQLIQNEKAFAITMIDTTGSASGRLTIAPLERAVHANVPDWQSGDVVRVINLYRRNDGELTTTASTVCLREADCPTFSLPAPTERREPPHSTSQSHEHS
jgi:hypothetical protein